MRTCGRHLQKGTHIHRKTSMKWDQSRKGDSYHKQREGDEHQAHIQVDTIHTHSSMPHHASPRLTAPPCSRQPHPLFTSLPSNTYPPAKGTIPTTIPRQDNEKKKTMTKTKQSEQKAGIVQIIFHSFPIPLLTSPPISLHHTLSPILPPILSILPSYCHHTISPYSPSLPFSPSLLLSPLSLSVCHCLNFAFPYKTDSSHHHTARKKNQSE